MVKFKDVVKSSQRAVRRANFFGKLIGKKSVSKAGVVTNLHTLTSILEGCAESARAFEKKHGHTNEILLDVEAVAVLRSFLSDHEDPTVKSFLLNELSEICLVEIGGNLE